MIIHVPNHQPDTFQITIQKQCLSFWSRHAKIFNGLKIHPAYAGYAWICIKPFVAMIVCKGTIWKLQFGLVLLQEKKR